MESSVGGLMFPSNHYTSWFEGGLLSLMSLAARRFNWRHPHILPVAYLVTDLHFASVIPPIYVSLFSPDPQTSPSYFPHIWYLPHYPPQSHSYPVPSILPLPLSVLSPHLKEIQGGLTLDLSVSYLIWIHDL